MKKAGEIFGAVVAALFIVCISPVLLVAAAGYGFYGTALKLWWWRKHGRYGRDFLIVYSESPKWADLIPAMVLPLLGSRAVVANVSKNPKWKSARSLERQVHRHWGGQYEHTPIVVRLSPFRWVKEVRLYSAFVKNAKANDPSELEEKLASLRQMVESSRA